MFREMARKKQQLSREACIAVLESQPRGVLSVQGDDGYPYGMPMNYLYDLESGHIFFHGGRTGHRVDAAERCDKASFCVYDEGWRRESEWSLNISSVIVFGRLRRVEDEARAMDISRRLSLRYTDDMEYIEREIRNFGALTLCYELVPEHMSGKLVNES